MSVGDAYRMDFGDLIRFVAMELNQKGLAGQFQFSPTRVSGHMSCNFYFHQPEFTLSLTEPHTETLGGKALAMPGRFTTPVGTGVFNANDFREVITTLIAQLLARMVRDDKRKRDAANRPELARAVVVQTEAAIEQLAQMTRNITAALAGDYNLDPDDGETTEFIRASIMNRFYSSHAWKN